ncbi:MAG TPA: 50S ribosomal protein L9, partial [Gaiellaceae bacterium]|nr:50S ribosomal protein L9 [Gaiellaceae bacterium]
DVILLQDVDKVGLRGDVVSVSRGYMRNYLRPRRLAEEATPARVAELEKREGHRARHEAQTFEHAQEIAGKLAGAELRFDVNAGAQGTLFGSVTATQIADALWEQRKIRVDRRKIDLPDPIKRIGRYQIPIEVFTDVTAEVRVAVVPEGGELPPEEELEALAAAEEAAEAAEAEAAAETAAAVEEAIAEVEAEEEEEAAEEAPPDDERAPAGAEEAPATSEDAAAEAAPPGDSEAEETAERA